MDCLEEASEYTKQHAIPALGYYPKQPVSMGVSFCWKSFYYIKIYFKTTLIAVEFADGIVVGTDSRTSAGLVTIYHFSYPNYFF